MAFTYGFYNSVNGDRKYNAKHFSDLFNALIDDGVFSTVGEILATVAGTGMQVIVKTGMAWFDSTWNINDSWMPFTIAPSDISLPRFDAIVLEVMEADEYRSNSIKLIKGTPAVNPVKPALVNTETIHQHPLSYIRVNGGATAITDSNIEIMIGKTGCPFVTGFLESVSITDLFNQWGNQFTTWWDNIKLLLNENTVGHLQNQIDTLNSNVNLKLDTSTFNSWYNQLPTTANRLLKSKASNSERIPYEILPEGTTGQFLRGDLTWQSFVDLVTSTVYGKYSTEYGRYTGSSSNTSMWGDASKSLTFNNYVRFFILIAKAPSSYSSTEAALLFVGWNGVTGQIGATKTTYVQIDRSTTMSQKTVSGLPNGNDWSFEYVAFCHYRSYGS